MLLRRRLLSVSVHLVNEGAHPEARRDHEQRVREEQQVALAGLLKDRTVLTESLRFTGRSHAGQSYLTVLRLDLDLGHVQNWAQGGDIVSLPVSDGFC